MLIAGIFLVNSTAKAQLEFENFNAQLDGFPLDFYGDTISDVLYLGGQFGFLNGQVTSAIVKYDDNSWHTIGDEFVVGGVTGITVFQDTLYIGGIQPHPGGLKKWSDSLWTSVGNMEVHGQVFDLKVIDNELWVAGNFDSIGNVPAHGLARWDGHEWKTAYDLPIIDPEDNVNRINTVIEYKGEIYIGGNFTNLETGMNEIAKWNGTEWTDVGGGIKPHTFSAVFNFTEYNGELYVMGRFLSSEGNADNNIMRWNGEEWLPCGGGVMSSAGYATVFDDKLWVTGQMSSAAGMPADGLAVWDGEEWCVPGNEFDQWPGPLVEFHDSLFIGGAFQTIDGENFSYLAKWSGQGDFDTCGVLPNGAHELVNEHESLLVYPNPATDHLTIQLPASHTQPTEVKIYGIDGRCVLHKHVQANDGTMRLDLHTLPSGIYMLTLYSANEQHTARFVKQ